MFYLICFRKTHFRDQPGGLNFLRYFKISPIYALLPTHAVLLPPRRSPHGAQCAIC
jgi:hypothetical protein